MNRKLKSALHNTLKSLLSRNSDYNGYWIFGFIIKAEQNQKIDIINENISSNDPEKWFQKYSKKILEEQLSKIKYDISKVINANIILHVSEEKQIVFPQRKFTYGFKTNVIIEIEDNQNKKFSYNDECVIAYHDENREMKSAR